MTTIWLEMQRDPGEAPEETQRRVLPAPVAESFAENGMPLSMLDRQDAGYAQAWLRAMLAVRIADDDQTTRDAITPVVEDCERNPNAIVRVAA